jgi:hypothetical protein
MSLRGLPSRGMLRRVVARPSSAGNDRRLGRVGWGEVGWGGVRWGGVGWGGRPGAARPVSGWGLEGWHTSDVRRKGRGLSCAMPSGVGIGVGSRKQSRQGYPM